MAASAASGQTVQLSGHTFHRAVCPGPAALGEARCFGHVVTDRAGNILANLDRFARPLVTRNATPAGYVPADLQSAYNMGAYLAGGSAVTIAIVDAYGYPNAERDLGVYRAQFGLPACTTANGCFKMVNQNGVQGSYPRSNTGWDQEQALDLDMVSAMCPNCHILLVEASSATFGNLAAAENTAALHAHAISNSYGGSEVGSSSYNGAYNHPGIAVTVSTGDSGYGVQFPASSNYVTAVGGTTLTRVSGGRGWSETAWSGGGSGCSSVYPKPSWQASITLCAYRMEADTSAVADPNTGVAVYGPVTSRTSGWMVFGGTSVSAPLTAAIYGLNGGNVTYGSDPYSHASSLYDVTQGSNGSCGGSYFCTAGLGYDGPTGLGTPNGDAAF